eukprot:1983405-Rhodomonas_salina.1
MALPALRTLLRAQSRSLGNLKIAWYLTHPGGPFFLRKTIPHGSRPRCPRCFPLNLCSPGVNRISDADQPLDLSRWGGICFSLSMIGESLSHTPSPYPLRFSANARRLSCTKTRSSTSQNQS